MEKRPISQDKPRERKGRTGGDDVCPRCGYIRSEVDDEFLSPSECPGCGEPYEKQMKTRISEAENVPSQWKCIRCGSVSTDGKMGCQCDQQLWRPGPQKIEMGIAEDSQSTRETCPKCSMPTQQGASYCPNCGVSLGKEGGKLKEIGASNTKSLSRNRISKPASRDPMKLHAGATINTEQKLPTRWLSFYTYVYLPFGIVNAYAQELARYDRLVERGYAPHIDPMTFVLPTIISIFTLALIYGLHRRCLWAWFLNLISIGLFTFIAPLSSTRSTGGYVVAVILLAGVFALPNYLYFKKRRSLFY